MDRPAAGHNNKKRIQFKEGIKLEARDHLDDKWWEAKVLEVDFSCSEVLVHFIGWNVRHDEWIKMDSPRLQPTSRKTRRTSNGTEGTPQKVSEYKQGEEVMAVWNKIKYPAKILRLEPDGSYMIEYYDGVRKKLRPQFIRRVSGEDIPFIQNCKEELEVLHAGQPNGVSSTEDGRLRQPPTPNTEVVLEKGRRRKSKFNIKEIFNIQQKKRLKAETAEESRSPSPSTTTISTSSKDADEDTTASSAAPTSDKSSTSSSSSLSFSDLTSSSSTGAAAAAAADSDEVNPPVSSSSASQHASENIVRNFVDRNAGSSNSSCSSSSSGSSDTGHAAATDKFSRQNLHRISRITETAEGVGGEGGKSANRDSSKVPALPAELNCDIIPGREGSPSEDGGTPLPEDVLESSESLETGSEEGTPSEKENLPAVNLPDTAATAAAAAAADKSANKILLPVRKSTNNLLLPEKRKSSATAAADNSSNNKIIPGTRKSTTKDTTTNHSLTGGGSMTASADGLGKRSRKRKRFPDEEPELTGAARKRTAVNGPRSGGGDTSVNQSKFNRMGSKVTEEIPASGSAALLSPKKSKKPVDLNPVKSGGRSAVTAPTAAAAAASPSPKSSAIVGSPASSSTTVRTSTTTSTLSSVLTSPSSSTSARSPPASSRGSPPTGGTASPGDPRFPYLSFDFSLPPDQLLANLKEGLTVPGIGCPITMRAVSLPPGWRKWVYVRGKGLTMGKWDVYVESPDGKSFRSKMDLSRYFEANDLEHNIDDFDFVLDPQLKKIRNVWKELRKQLPAGGGAADRSLTPACEGGSSIFLPGTNVSALPYELMSVATSASASAPTTTTPSSSTTSTPSRAAVKSPPVLVNGTSPLPPSVQQKSAKLNNDKTRGLTERFGKSAETPPREASNKSVSPGVTPVAGNSTPGVRVSGTASSSLPGHTPGTERGVRCNLNNCNKLFRNEKLLLQHVKHYHSHLTEILGEVLGNSPTVTDMAYLRTRVGDHCKDFETDGALLEILKKAERRYDRQEKRHRAAVNKSSPPAVSSSGSPVKSAVSDRLKKRRAVEPEAEKKVEPVDTKKEEEKLMKSSPPPNSTSSSPQPDPVSTPATPQQQPKGADLPATPLNTDPKKGKSRVKRSSLHESLQVEAEKAEAAKEESVSDQSTAPAAPAAAAAPAVTASSAGSTPPTWKRRPVRSPEEKKVETMTEEEVVMCTCGRAEGDGLMIQCDVCLTWQHGLCLGINTEQQVPEMYICSTCENPRLGRQSSIYLIPTYWKGNPSLPTISRTSSTSPGVRLDQLCNLMSELSSLASILHSLNIKLHVAEQKNHPKVFMWSSAWEETEDTNPSPVLQPEEEDPGSSSVLPWTAGAEDAGFLSPVFGLDLPGDFGQANFAGLPAGQDVGGDGDQGSDAGDPKLTAETAAMVKRPGSRTRSVTFSDELPTVAPTTSPPSTVGGIAGTGKQHQPSKSILRDSTAAATTTSVGEDSSSLVNGDQSSAAGNAGGSVGGHIGQPDFIDSDNNGDSREKVNADGDGRNDSKAGNKASVTADNNSKSQCDKTSAESMSEDFDASATIGARSDSGEFDQTIIAVDGGCNSSVAADGEDLEKTTTAADDDFSFFDFPSLTEVKELLPGVLKDISGLDIQAANQPPPSRRPAAPPHPPHRHASVIIPEPKLINREESRANLVSHLDYMQHLVDEQLTCIEHHVAAAEEEMVATSASSSRNPLDCTRINRGMFKLVKELRCLKKLNAMLLERP